MSQQNKKMQLLGNAPIPQALLAMGIPTMIGMLVNALYNLVEPGNHDDRTIAILY